jgi:hypothetical protein
MCVAAVLSDRTFSLCGLGQDLQAFKTKYLHSTISVRSANVHGYFHSGTETSRSIREAVLDDSRTRKILVPGWDDLEVPIRSTIDGSFMAPSGSSTTLLEKTLDCLMMQRVEWHSVAVSLLKTAKDFLSQEKTSSYHIQALGPNARSLLSNFKGHNIARLTVAHGLSFSQQLSSDDVAIIGMDVNFPSARGEVEFWETIQQGLNVASVVRLTSCDNDRTC